MCGEYGSEEFSERAHYHYIIFGLKFEDQYFWKERNGNRFYRSPTLEKLWTFGHSDISCVTFKSAGYVARYVLKKQTGTLGEKLYAETNRIPPYTAMSLKPGLGESWYKKFKSDLFPHDYAVLPDGRKTSVPKYYRALLEREDPDLAEKLRDIRVEKAQDNPDNSPERLAVREKVKTNQTNKLLRTI